MHPARGEKEQVLAALRVCNGDPDLFNHCPIREECLLHAIQNNEEKGVWGGKTSLERRKLRRAWLASLRKDEEPVVIGG